jgi:SNF2 family DNA or RNA helicase
MATEYVAELDGHVVTENLAITRMLRLQQIACGWWPSDEENGELIPIESAFSRLVCLKRILEDLPDQKVIIWARFKNDFRLLQQELGDAAVSYHGGVSETSRKSNLLRFRNDPTCLYLVANPQNAGIGLTLNEAAVHVWYCNQFDLELRTQGEDRSHRIGQKADSVLYIDIEARRTMEPKVISALRQKKNVADLVTMDPKNFFLVYEEEA